ncbi:MAG: flippase-like domain-containing protein [Chloroflexota bacterium]|nr:flippase-like domain-containing protein [Chloroflexota bacterium]
MRDRRLWIGILVSGLFLFLALNGQNLRETWTALRSADYRFLVPALVLYFVGVWIRAVRWRALLTPFGSFSSSALFPVVVIGYMANDVLPARMGEVVRVYVLSQRERLPKTVALGTVVVERILDAVVMLFLLAMAALLVPLNGAVERVALIAAGALLVGLGPLLLLVLWPDHMLRLISPVAARLPVGLLGLARSAGGGFLSGLRVVRSGRVLVAGLSLTLMAWLFEAGMYWTLAVGFDLPVGVPLIVLTLAVTNLATLVPSAPGYLGAFEFGALLVLVGLAGLNRELATGYVIALHAALVLPITLWGFYYWGTHNLSLRRIQRDSLVPQGGGRSMNVNPID